jgi:hypothetical protein
MYGMHTNEKIERFVNMHISCDISLLPSPLQNAQHQHMCTCKKKNYVVYKFFILKIVFFVQKSQVTLNELELNSIDTMCSLIIEKYINRHHQYKFLLLTKI